MPTEWETLYRKALEEQGPENVTEACDRARRAINERLVELATAGVGAEGERERLLEALRALVIHEHNRRLSN